MDVLVYLVANSERVVLKEELMEAVWSGPGVGRD
jgi:DNA-binding winged helix-turn-helix (wHTH) protein